MDHKKRILLVDDHPVVRFGLKQMIEQDPQLSICGEAGNMIDAMHSIQELDPDLVIIDITLGNQNGIELIKQIKPLYPKLPLFVLTMHDESIYAERALRAGAKGFVQKEESPEIIRTAIHNILKGNVFVSQEISNRLLERNFFDEKSKGETPEELLSDREFESFVLISQGLKPKDIAEKMEVSVKTVENTRIRIREKLGLESAKELIQYAIQWNKVNPI